MGVVNVTPDSFSDGGAWFDARGRGRARPRAGRRRAPTSSTSAVSPPGPAPSGRAPQEELRRVVPVVEALGADGAVVSVDTMRAEVAAAALDAGASLVNDVSGGLADPEMAGAGRRRGPCPSSRCTGAGTAATCSQRAVYDDVVADVVRELGERRRGAGRRPASARTPSCSTRVRVRQERRAQLGAAAPPRRARGARPPRARRHLAQDLPRPVGRAPRRPPARRWSATSSPRRRPCTSPGRRVVRARPRRRRDRRRPRRRRARTAGERRGPDDVPGPPRERASRRDRIDLRGVAAAATTACSRTRSARARSSSSTSQLAATSRAAGRSDDLADTVNYAEVGAEVRRPGHRGRAVRPHRAARRGHRRRRASRHDRGRRGRGHRAQAAGAGRAAVLRRGRDRRRARGVPVVVALGANLGAAAGRCRRGHRPAQRRRGLRVRAVSQLVETEPVGGPEQPATSTPSCSPARPSRPRSCSPSCTASRRTTDGRARCAGAHGRSTST